MQLQCWKCGEPLKDIILPFSRLEECSACTADQHVCKLCREYDPNISNQCKEDRAEFEVDKERANFCDFFAPRPDAHPGKDAQQAQEARAKLADLFGEEPTQTPNPQDHECAAAPKTEAEKALEELHRLFGD